MIEKNLSFHVVEDRIDRATFIMTNCEIGIIVKEAVKKDEYGRLAIHQLTNTGIMFIRNPQTKKLVTLYIANMKQVQAMYGSYHIPDTVYKYVKKYSKYQKMQNEVRY